MTSATSVYDLAKQLLTVSAEILAATPGGVPARQFVCHGDAPVDCPEILAVSVGIIAPGGYNRGTPVPDPKMAIVPVIPLTVWAFRCASALPSGGGQIKLPTATKIDADAQLVMPDGWALFCGLRNRYRAGTLFPGFPCRPMEVGAALPIAPSGGTLGWAISVNVALDGYDA